MKIMETALVSISLVFVTSAHAATTHTVTDGRFDLIDASGSLTADGHNDAQFAFDLLNGGGTIDTTTDFIGDIWHADIVSMDFHSSLAGITAGGLEANDFTWTTESWFIGGAAVKCNVSDAYDGCVDERSSGGHYFGSTDNSYTYNLDVGQVAAGMFFDWATNEDIPVLAIWQFSEISPDGSMSFMSVDLNGNVSGTNSGNCGSFDICGVKMIEGPFPEQAFVFSGTIGNGLPIPSIPVPAAIWLFGSGLIGLIGLARRKSNV